MPLDALVKLAKEQSGFLMPKIIHKAVKNSTLNINFSAVQKLGQMALKH